MRILVSGGGTAGHIAPILAVVDALTQQDSTVDILYVGQADALEARLAREAGINFMAISAGKFRRQPTAGLLRNLADVGSQARNIRDVGRAGKGFAQAIAILRRFRPDVVFIKGGYVGLPLGPAARLLRIPYITHESDISPGLANRLLARHAAAIATGFPISYYTQWPSHKLVFTGNPVRPSMLGAHRLEGLQHFGLTGDRPVVLVLGGSQGARSINNAVADGISQLAEGYDVIHITGTGELERVKAITKSADIDPKRYQIYPYMDEDLALAYAAADLVVSRAGAGTIAELAALGKPAIIIPNEEAAAHQIINARALSRAGAAEVLSDSKLTPDTLRNLIAGILGSPERQAALQHHIAAFAHPKAAETLARLIRKVGAGERL